MRKQANQKKQSRKPRQMVVRDDFHLPPVQAAFNTSLRCRYVSNTAKLSVNFTAANILDTVCVCTSPTAAVQLYEFFRLRRIRLWAVGSASTPTTVCVHLPGPQELDGQYVSDTSMSINPAYLDVKPAKQSLVGFWQASSANVVMQLTAPVGAVLDLDLEFRATIGGAATSVGASVSGGASGVIFRRGIDNLPKATTTMYPQVPDGGVV